MRKVQKNICARVRIQRTLFPIAHKKIIISTGNYLLEKILRMPQILHISIVTVADHSRQAFMFCLCSLLLQRVRIVRNADRCNYYYFSSNSVKCERAKNSS